MSTISPSVTAMLDYFYAPFIEDKDRRGGMRGQGGLILSHIHLLLGCAVPFWVAAHMRHVCSTA